MTSTSGSSGTSRSSASVSGLSRRELSAHLEQTRAQLASNLDALEDKVNVPKQLSKAGRKARRKVAQMRQENPLALAGIVAGAVIAVGITAFLVVKISAKGK